MKTFTHDDLVRIAERWLRRQHPVVLVDVNFAVASELPDAIGWTNGGYSTLVECKTSRSDFVRDAKKWFRRTPAVGMGYARYFLAPDGVLDGLELPERWGLLCAGARGVRVAKEAQAFAEWCSRGERALLVGAVRRATEGWGRRAFGEIAPPIVDGDPHPTTAKVIRELRTEVLQLRDQLRDAKKEVGR